MWYVVCVWFLPLISLQLYMYGTHTHHASKEERGLILFLCPIKVPTNQVGHRKFYGFHVSREGWVRAKEMFLLRATARSENVRMENDPQGKKSDRTTKKLDITLNLDFESTHSTHTHTIRFCGLPFVHLPNCLPPPYSGKKERKRTGLPSTKGRVTSFFLFVYKECQRTMRERRRRTMKVLFWQKRVLVHVTPHSRG